MNDPRDDAASLFPSALTDRAIAAGADLTFASSWKSAGEVVVLGADVAISEHARADFTVVIVAAYSITTGCRRILEAQRHKGLNLRAQEDLIADLCARFDVTVAVVEDNGFKKWLLERLEQRPETRGRVHGHTTGRDKRSAQEGITAPACTPCRPVAGAERRRTLAPFRPGLAGRARRVRLARWTPGGRRGP
jgi:hypothetical protein